MRIRRKMDSKSDFISNISCLFSAKSFRAFSSLLADNMQQFVSISLVFSKCVNLKIYPKSLYIYMTN